MRRLILAAALAVPLALAFPAVALAAGTVTTSQGEAGYYTQSFATVFTQVDGTWDLLPTAGNLGVTTGDIEATSGAIGLQLCNSSDKYMAQIGVLQTSDAPATFEVAYGAGDSTSTAADPCPDGGLLGTGSAPRPVATGLTGLVIGDSVQAQIEEYHHGILFTAAVSAGGIELTSWSQWISGGPAWFNEAGAGVVQDPANVTACPGGGCGTDLADFSDVYAVTDQGAEGGFADWNPVTVESASNGSVFVAPGPLSPATGRTCIAGHWVHRKHHRRHWVAGSCTGGGPSSFSVLTGAPNGV